MDLRPKRRLEVMTNSREGTFQRCPRKAYNRYELGARPATEDEDRHLGSILHDALEAWWCALSVTLRAAWVVQMIARTRDESWRDAPDNPLLVAQYVVASEPDLFVRAKARAMLAGYHRRWIDAGIEPLAVECEFYAPHVNPTTGQASRLWIRGGKIDVLGRRAGRQVLMDHKSTKEDISPTSTYWKRRRMDPQISAYFSGARAIGYDPETFIYDVLWKPGLRPHKATPVELRKYTEAKTVKGVFQPSRLYANQREFDETPEEFHDRCALQLVGAQGENLETYFVREDIPRLDRDLDEHRRDAWHWAKMYRDAQLAGRWPRTPAACEDFHQLCEYFDVCSGAASIDDPARFRQVDNPHTELEHVPPDDLAVTPTPEADTF